MAGYRLQPNGIQTGAAEVNAVQVEHGDSRRFSADYVNALLIHAEEKRVEAYLSHGIPLQEMHPHRREKIAHKVEVAAQMIVRGEFGDDEITGVRRVMLREAGCLP